MLEGVNFKDFVKWLAAFSSRATAEDRTRCEAGDGVGWNGMGWDGMGWDGMGWDGVGWGGVGWGGVGWGGMGWVGMVFAMFAQLYNMDGTVPPHPPHHTLPLRPFSLLSLPHTPLPSDVRHVRRGWRWQDIQGGRPHPHGNTSPSRTFPSPSPLPPVVFAVYDVDGDGKISKGDLLAMLRDLSGGFLSDEQREVGCGRGGAWSGSCFAGESQRSSTQGACKRDLLAMIRDLSGGSFLTSNERCRRCGMG
ncbi:unnamed protein product [Closterium sp. NIES-54]